MRFLALALALALALCLPASAPPGPRGESPIRNKYAGHTLPEIMDAIAKWETGRKRSAVGSKGERTEYQVLPRCLADYNWRHQTNLTMADLMRDQRLGYRVAAWRFSHAWRQYPKHHPKTRLILALSAYNRGERGNQEHGIGWAYCDGVMGFLE